MTFKMEDIKTYVTIAAFVAQALGTVYYFGQKQKEMEITMSHAVEELKEIKTAQTRLMDLSIEMAVLRANQNMMQQTLDDMRRRVQ